MEFQKRGLGSGRNYLFFLTRKIRNINGCFHPFRIVLKPFWGCASRSLDDLHVAVFLVSTPIFDSWEVTFLSIALGASQRTGAITSFCLPRVSRATIHAIACFEQPVTQPNRV